MQASERALNLFWIAFGLAIAATSRQFTLFDAAGPGGGFLPMLAGLVIAGCGLSLASRRPPEHTEAWPARSVWVRMAFVVAGLAAITLLMPTVGFILSVAPVMVVLMQAVERQSWLTVILVSLVATFAVYALFTHLLGTTLPRGLFGF
jgi:hypothetical protein